MAISVKEYRELIMDGAVEDIMVACYNSIAFTSRMIFPERFFREFGPSHEELFEALDDRSLRQILVMAHRDFGKTSLLQLAYSGREVLFMDSRFLVPVSCSATQAVMQSENLKTELQLNPIINSLWGSVKAAGKETPFSKDMWVATIDGGFGSVILPRGSGQQMRGLIYGNFRPDLLLIDDLEDPENLLSEEQRFKQKSWFFATLRNIVDIAEENWRILFMGTPSHEDSLLWDLESDSHWTTIKVDLCDENFKTKWPTRFTQVTVDKIVSEFREQKKMDEFYREFMNLPVSTEDATFKQEFFSDYDPAEVDLNNRTICESIVLADYAKTAKPHSADSAVVGVGIGVKENRFWVRDIKHGKWHPEELYREIFDMALSLNAVAIGIEVTGLEEFIKHPVLDYMKARGLNFPIVWLKAKGKKEFRVRELVAYYRQGLIKHNPACCRALESQLMSFPRSKLWDIMDALGYLPKMLEEGEVYFQFFGSENEEEEDKRYNQEIDSLDEEEESLDGYEIYSYA